MVDISSALGPEHPGVLNFPSLSELDREELLRIARTVASDVGRFLITDRPKELHASVKSSPTDVVTEMDRIAEQRIIAKISSRRPHDGFLGEEGTSQSGFSGVTWIIDPIDGTTNYLYRLPMWSVSIGVAVGTTVVAGVVEVPAMGVQYFGSLGKGAWMASQSKTDAQILTCRDSSRLAQSLVATGFGYSEHRRAQQALILTQVLPHVRDLRRSGAASVDLCWVAAGLVDGYYEYGLHPWDYAAGALIAEEAGARVADLYGGPPTERTIMASAPGIFDELRALLLAANADSCT